MRGAHDGTGLRIGIACAIFNGGIALRLLDGALDALSRGGHERGDVTVAWAPGAFELPLVARAFASAGAVDAVLCFGAVVRGETGHYEFVAGECASGIQQVQLTTGVPVIFGVLTTETLEQALARSEPGDPGTRGGRRRSRESRWCDCSGQGRFLPKSRPASFARLRVGPVCPQ